MSSGSINPVKFSVTLNPHQEAFVRMCLEPTNKKAILLRADVGLGKTMALAIAAARFLNKWPLSRILILSFPGMEMQYRDVLEKSGVRPLVIDRFRFREMLDTVNEVDFWASGYIFILSPDFAKLPDVMEYLGRVRWDFVIIDEAHAYTGKRYKLLESICAKANKIAFASQTEIESPCNLSTQDISRIDWRRDDLMHQKDSGFEGLRNIRVVEVQYIQSESEQQIIKAISEMIENMQKDSAPWSKLVANNLKNNLWSSWIALENNLEKIERSSDVKRELAQAQEESSEEFEPVEQEVLTNESLSSNRWSNLAAKWKKYVEALNSDSKLKALNDLLAKLKSEGHKICVIANSASTLHYITADLESHAIPTALTIGNMSANDRQKAIGNFNNTSDVLVASPVSLQGIELNNVSALVFYDMPKSERGLWVIMSRMMRNEGGRPLTIYALVPRDDVQEENRHKIDILRKTLVT